MADPANRYGGGSGGKEARYSFPAADTARWDEAKRGADAPSPLHTNVTRVDAAQTGTMASGRGKLNGVKYGDDRWMDGFC